MSRTYKDRPFHLGGDRHKYFIANCHGAHGKFVRKMSRKRRRYEDNYFRRYNEIPKNNPWEHAYFD